MVLALKHTSLIHNLEEGQIQRSGFTALHTYYILTAPPPLPPAGKCRTSHRWQKKNTEADACCQMMWRSRFKLNVQFGVSISTDGCKYSTAETIICWKSLKCQSMNYSWLCCVWEQRILAITDVVFKILKSETLLCFNFEKRKTNCCDRKSQTWGFADYLTTTEDLKQLNCKLVCTERKARISLWYACPPRLPLTYSSIPHGCMTTRMLHGSMKVSVVLASRSCLNTSGPWRPASAC